MRKTVQVISESAEQKSRRRALGEKEPNGGVRAEGSKKSGKNDD
jgi:hypothetical protein